MFGAVVHVALEPTSLGVLAVHEPSPGLAQLRCAAGELGEAELEFGAEAYAPQHGAGLIGEPDHEPLLSRGEWDVRTLLHDEEPQKRTSLMAALDVSSRLPGAHHIGRPGILRIGALEIAVLEIDGRVSRPDGGPGGLAVDDQPDLSPESTGSFGRELWPCVRGGRWPARSR